MNKEFCNRCGTELGRYDGWRIEVTDRRRGAPMNRESSGLICDLCVSSTLSVVRDSVSGLYRRPQVVEFS